MVLTSKVSEEDSFSKNSLSNEQDEEEELLATEELRRSLDLKPRVLDNRQINLLAIETLDVFGTAKKQRNEGTDSLKSDEDKEHRVGDLAGFISVCVESEVDGTTNDLAAETVCQPVAEGFAAVPWLRVGNADGSLSLQGG